ncbi:MAG: hypothetical protein AAF411_09075 [Myxococcota bacterium]
MGFRSEQDALRGRVKSLERELQEARRELEAHQSVETPAESVETLPSRERWWLGRPYRLRFERVLPYEVDGEELNAIETMLERIFQTTTERAGRIGRTWKWNSVRNAGTPKVHARVEWEGRTTRVRVHQNLTSVGHVPFGLFGGLIPIALLAVVGLPSVLTALLAFAAFIVAGWVVACRAFHLLTESHRNAFARLHHASVRVRIANDAERHDLAQKGNATPKDRPVLEAGT